jgi:hypothetical protein
MSAASLVVLPSTKRGTADTALLRLDPRDFTDLPSDNADGGRIMLLLTDLTATLCTALVAGFAFGLLLLGNRRR